MGATLTASVDGVEDADGLDNATFAWQWLANDGAQDAAIDGATGTSYEVTPGDVGKTLKVRVTFTDDDGNEETLDSAATAAVVDLRPTVASLAMAEPPVGGWTDGDTVRLVDRLLRAGDGGDGRRHAVGGDRARRRRRGRRPTRAAREGRR